MLRLDVKRWDITQLARGSKRLPSRTGYLTFCCTFAIFNTFEYYRYHHFNEETIGFGAREELEKLKREYIDTHEECGGKDRWFVFVERKNRRNVTKV
ncbi:MAG: hypothetical protein IJF90_06235 [Synergistaceae bacterium]|nr:hypothetical protein [Synergistaceae bacterium]